MKKFVAKSIEEALEKAKQDFNCSLIQIEYEVIQNPSTGFFGAGIFGFGKKEAIIVATKKEEIQISDTTPQNTQTTLEQKLASHNTTQQTEIVTNQSIHQDSINHTYQEQPITNLATHQEQHIPQDTTNLSTLEAKPYTGFASIAGVATIQYAGHAGLGKKNVAIKKEEIQISDTTPQNTQTTLEQELASHHTARQTEIPSNIANTQFSNVTTDDMNQKNEDSLQTPLHTTQVVKSSTQHYQDKQPTEAKAWHNNVTSEKVMSEFDNKFYDETAHIPWQDSNISTPQNNAKNMEEICKEIQDELIVLLKFLPLDLAKVQVTPYDSYTISILIDGLDAALLIGQKGYRYKSLSYLLFNWVNACYGYGIRLEIAQFLKNQEEMIRVYLAPIIESARLNGKAQTKPLDGVLTHIALKILRDELPNKYIVFRDTADGEKYITISDFLTSSNYRNNGFGNMPKY